MSGGKQILYNLVAAFGGRRVSADASKYALDPERELVMWSPLEAKVDQALKGVFKTALDFSGATDSTLERRALLALQDDATLYPVTIALQPGGAVGSFAYLSQALLSSWKWGGDFNQVKTFDIKLLPQDRAWFGQVLVDSVGTAGVSATGAFPGVQVGAVAATVGGLTPSAGQYFLLSAHVLDPPGVGGTGTRTLQLVLESNPNNTDWTTAVVRATLPLATTGTPTAGQFQVPGSCWVVIDGDVAAVSDTWWRLRVSAISGSGANFYLLSAAAVGSKLNV